jgi:aldehyde dehydrogenase (NAD+)
MVDQIREFFGENPIESPDFARIINQQHFDRLENYLTSGTLITGGQSDREQLYIAPTILEDPSLDDDVMSEEIFGPILPVLSYRDLEDVMRIVKQRPDPLSLYVFTKNEKFQETILQGIPFGGGCINNTLVHFTNPNLPFGGIRSSGMGSYHGEASFQIFSHQKSIVKSSFWIDIKLRYQPYLDKLRLVKKFMK